MNRCRFCNEPTHNAKFCSRSCSGKFVAGGKPKESGVKVCKHCKTEFSWSGYGEKQKVFCGMTCSAAYNNSLHPKRVKQITATCMNCGADIARKGGVYCTMMCHRAHAFAMRVSEFEAGKATHISPRIREYILSKQGGVCAVCGCLPEHNGNPLTFILDHIDGDSTRNSPDNLRFVCPNCDSQLPTYKSKNMGKGRHSRRERYAKGKSY